MLGKLLPFIFAVLLLALFIGPVAADELLDVQNQINQKNSDLAKTQANLDQIKRNIAALGSSLTGTKAQLDQANAQVADIRKQLDQATADLEKKRSTLAYLINVRNQQIRSIYQDPPRAPFEMFLGSKDLTGFTENLVYQTAVVSDSRSLIKLVNKEVNDLVSVADNLQQARDQLDAFVNQLNNKLAQLNQSYQSANFQKYYLNNQMVKIQNTLKGLTTQQNQLIAAKLAAANQQTTVGNNPPISEPLPDPGFSPAYVLLTYGYPHRVGMSQYGAYGRAIAGQNYLQILQAYYGVSPSQVNLGTIRVANVTRGSYCSVASVNSITTLSMQDYLYGLGEMPSTWPMAALEAQAVAARTYAYRTQLSGKYAGYGFDIGSDTCDQVYLGYPKGGNWNSAVDQTNGQVLGGTNPIGAFYASTSGGYTCAKFPPAACSPGITDVAPGGSWPNDAYEGPKYIPPSGPGKPPGAPWFHTFWNGVACTGTFPWLTKAQVTDLLNATLLSEVDFNYNQYLTQNPACPGVTPGWTSDQIVTTLASRGVKDVGNLSTILPGFDGVGNTSSITFVSDNYPNGHTFSGSLFLSVFNVRSPGKLIILTTLYDVLIK